MYIQSYQIYLLTMIEQAAHHLCALPKKKKKKNETKQKTTNQKTNYASKVYYHNNFLLCPTIGFFSQLGHTVSQLFSSSLHTYNVYIISPIAVLADNDGDGRTATGGEACYLVSVGHHAHAHLLSLLLLLFLLLLAHYVQENL